MNRNNIFVQPKSQKHFKNINELNKAMRSLIINVRDNQGIPSTVNTDKSMAFALYECCKNEYILNVHYSQVISGNYTFQITDNTCVGEKGYIFLQETSSKRQVINYIIKSIWGIFLTIAGSVIAAAIIHLLGIN